MYAALRTYAGGTGRSRCPVYLMVAAERGQVPRLLLYLAAVAVFSFAVGVRLMLGLSTSVDNFGDRDHEVPAGRDAAAYLFSV